MRLNGSNQRHPMRRYAWGVFGLALLMVYFLTKTHQNVANSFALRHDGSTIARLQLELKSAQQEAEMYRRALERARFEAGHDGEASKLRQDRIYCMVPTTYVERKFQQILAVLNTWGKRCDVLKFFVEPPEEGVTIPSHIVDTKTGRKAELVVVPMVRKNDVMISPGVYKTQSCWAGGAMGKDGKPKMTACRHIWEKVWRSWVYVSKNDLDKAEWFFKVDDDTFLFPEFLRDFVRKRNWTHTDPHYFGHKVYGGRAKEGFVAGAMVGLSRRTIELVAPIYENMPNEYGDRSKFKHGRCVDRDGATQEITEALCLEKAGIGAEAMYDENNQDRVALFALSDSLVVRKRATSKSWFWKGKPVHAVCCASDPVAFHEYKKAEHIERLERLLYDPNDTELAELFSSHEFYMSVLENPNNIPTKSLVREKPSGSLLAKWTEVMYLLNVRRRIIDLGQQEQI